MKLIVAALLLLALHGALSKIRPPKKTSRRSLYNLDTKCHTVKCSKNKPVCRMVKKGCGRVRAQCLKCVPADADTICNNNAYLRALLVGGKGKGKWKKQLKPYFCSVGKAKKSTRCPLGSVCVPDANQPEIGVCCYGKPSRFSDAIKTGDRKCGVCGKCRAGKECRKSVSRCGRLRWRCQSVSSPNKPGTCPPVRYNVNGADIRCGWPGQEDKCKADKDCPKSEKCCPGLCTGKRCKAVPIEGPIVTIIN